MPSNFDDDDASKLREKIKLRMSDFKIKLLWFRRQYIPYLVFYGQDIDVGIRWKENRLPGQMVYPDMESAVEAARKELQKGHIFEIEKMMDEIGVGFDTGLGPSGRDWKWDWSLRGPVSVRFLGPCRTKERRN